MTKLFRNRSDSDYQRSYAQYLPGGKMFSSKDDTRKGLYDFLNGISVEARKATEMMNAYNDQFFPDETTQFLEEWEKALGIPDDCLDTEGTVEERRRNVLVKLAEMNVQTSQDFKDIATLFGVAVDVYGGADPAVSPAITPDRAARNTIVIVFIPASVFSYTFTFTFGTDEIAILQCLFEKIKPASCQVIFQST